MIQVNEEDKKNENKTQEELHEDSNDETTDEEGNESFKDSREEDTEDVEADNDAQKQKDKSNKQNDEAENKNETRKSTRNRKLPGWMTGEFVWLSKTDKMDHYQNQSSYNEAMESQERKQWLTAMHEELSSLEENDTWELVTRPQNAQVIQNRWVLRTKTLDNGSSRFKARLVAKGCAKTRYRL